MREEIFALIEEVLGVPKGTVTCDTVMTDLDEWDSLAQVILIGELEMRYGAEFDSDEVAEITSVGQILEKLGA